MEQNLIYPSINDVHEQPLVNELVRWPRWRSVIFDLAEFPKHRRTFTEVLLHKSEAPGAVLADGDVDVLMHAVRES